LNLVLGAITCAQYACPEITLIYFTPFDNNIQIITFYFKFFFADFSPFLFYFNSTT
jgi:hypothetical protein